MNVDDESMDSNDWSSSEEIGDDWDSLLVSGTGDDGGGVVENSLSIH